MYLFLALGEEPEFVEQIENATVPVGRNVKLSCSVRNLGTYKVSKIFHRLIIFLYIFYFPTSNQ